MTTQGDTGVARPGGGTPSPKTPVTAGQAEAARIPADPPPVDVDRSAGDNGSARADSSARDAAGKPLTARDAAGDPLAGRDAAAEPVAALAGALRRLRDTLTGIRFRLPLHLSPEAERHRAALIDQIDSYLLPRLSRLDEPMLVVVGGSTGAGKSTLINSLVGEAVSRAGVLRPTTRAPILVCDPGDTDWFAQAQLLPEMPRAGLPGAGITPDGTPLRVHPTPQVPPGVALLDAPDIDSVVETNRQLAGQLLSTADLWLFLTTASRYADAVPWEVLRDARERGAEVAVVLDRVPAEAREVVEPHLRQMLVSHGFPNTPVFVITEQRLDDRGLLPGSVVAPVREWLAGLAKDRRLRTSVVRETLSGTTASLHPRVAALAAQADAQRDTAVALRTTVRHTYAEAFTRMDSALWSGALLRGEVLARWWELIDSGQLIRAVEAHTGRPGHIRTSAKREPQPGHRFTDALLAAVSALVATAASDASEQTAAQWGTHPAGRALLDASQDRRLAYRLPSADLEQRAERLVGYWHRGVEELVRAELGVTGPASRQAAYTAEATGLLVMISLFVASAPGSTASGTRPGSAWSTDRSAGGPWNGPGPGPRPRPWSDTRSAAGARAELSRKLINAVAGDPGVAQLAAKARQAFLDRLRVLLEEERQHFTGLLDRTEVDPVASQRLREAADQVERARIAAGLVPVGKALPQFPPLVAEPETPGEPAPAEQVEPGPEEAEQPETAPQPEPDTDAEAGTRPAAGSAPAAPGSGSARKAEDGTVRKSTKTSRRKR